MRAGAEAILCVDVGSTFTKAALVDPAGVVTTAATPTTLHTDVLDGIAVLAHRLGATARTPRVACSSAGGGLRLAVVGYERQVTAEAGFRVGLSAGAKVVHVATGALDAGAVAALRAASPDIVLLVGGTDGGNADVLLHNAVRLARARIAAPVVVAGNVAARGQAVDVLASTGRRFVVADNVVPSIGAIAPESARAAIRDAFLQHVIGGKGLSRGREFAAIVRAPTPDAVLSGVEVVAATLGEDVLVVDVGGATTDVYSAISSVTPLSGDPIKGRFTRETLWGEADASRVKQGGAFGASVSPAPVVAELPCARTVEGDLGMRWNAEGVVEAAHRERLPLNPDLAPYAASLASRPDHLPVSDIERLLDAELARLAAVVAVRRHARPSVPGDTPRDLSGVGLVLGSGGVLRADPDGTGRLVLEAVTQDHAGGWRLPRAPRAGVDDAYLLFVVGLLADDRPDLAARLADRLADRLVDGLARRRGSDSGG